MTVPTARPKAARPVMHIVRLVGRADKDASALCGAIVSQRNEPLINELVWLLPDEEYRRAYPPATRKLICKACKQVSPRPSKFRNRWTVSDGIKFQSGAEARRWSELTMAERAGEIRNLRRQVVYELPVNGVVVCRYKADFVYCQLKRVGADGVLSNTVVEDVKGAKTNTVEFNLKKKLMRAIHGIEIVEVRR